MNQLDSVTGIIASSGDNLSRPRPAILHRTTRRISIATSLFLLSCALPIFAATPSSGTLGASTTSVSWNGFPGPAYQNEALTLSSNADASCTDGTTADVSGVNPARGDSPDRPRHFAVSGPRPPDDYDVYVHAASLS